MGEPARCRECGAEVASADPLDGQCPRCLLELARAAAGRAVPGRSGMSGKRFGDFFLLKRIGAGPLGAVHEALEQSTSRHLALKLWDAASSPEDGGPGGRKPWPAAALRHPGIVRVFSYGRRGDALYVAMELHREGSLRQCIDTTPTRRLRAIPPGRLVRMMADTAAALEHAHGQGIVHGGITPDNLLFGEGAQRLLLGDFEPANGSALHSILWIDDSVAARYRAPELTRGPACASARSDVYSLAACLRDALAPGQPASTQALLLRCLAPDPAKRPGSAGELASALSATIEDGSAG